MTRLAGPIRQMGIVVRNLDAAIGQWCDTVGIGPFAVFRHIIMDDYHYRGEPAPSPEISLAIAHSGSTQVEIIEQHNDAASGYRDFIAAGREGLQHVSTWFANAPQYDAAYARLVEDGLECVHKGRIGATRFAYFSRPDGSWPQVEISEALAPGSLELTQTMERLAAGWTGSPQMIDVADLAAHMENPKP